MKPINDMLEALQKGKSLTKVETWKKTGVATALVASILSALSGVAVYFGWIPIGIDSDVVMQAASFLVTVVGFVLGYLGVATTKKIGIKPPKDQATAVEVDA